MKIGNIEYQKFCAGDIAICDGGYKVKIIKPIFDNDTWFYEVQRIDSPHIREEIHQDELRSV